MDKQARYLERIKNQKMVRVSVIIPATYRLHLLAWARLWRKRVGYYDEKTGGNYEDSST